MKNNFKKALLALLPLSAVAVTAPLVVTSCSTANNKVDVVKFNAKQSVARVGEPQIVLDPNINKDAQNEAVKTFKAMLSVETLQADFNRVLTKFFETYELETNKVLRTKLEAEIETIRVKSFNKDALTAELEVTYDVEVGKNEKLVTQVKTFQIKPMFATKPQIQQITQMLVRAPEDLPVGPSGSKIDMEDLRELYVGDKSDAEPSIFEQINAFTEENSRYGGLLGYELDLSALTYDPKAQVLADANATTPNTKFFAPSSEIKKYFIPEMQDYKLPSGLDLTMSYDKIRTKTITDLITPATPSPQEVGKTTFETLLADAEAANIALYNKYVQSVTISESTVDTNALEAAITIRESADQPDATAMLMVVVISIDKSWLAPAK